MMYISSDCGETVEVPGATMEDLDKVLRSTGLVGEGGYDTTREFLDTNCISVYFKKHENEIVNDLEKWVRREWV